MEIKFIESSHNQSFKEILSIKSGDRKKDGLVLVEGEDLVHEAERAGKLVSVISDRADDLKGAKVPGYLLSSKLYARLSIFKTPAHLMGIAKLELTDKLGERCVYLDCVQDPGNVGTIIRTAYSFGFDSVIVSPDSASLSNPKTLQAAKGAEFLIRVGCLSFDKIESSGSHIFLTVLDGKDESLLEKPQTPFVLVLGNEGRGIPKEHQKIGEKIKIRMGEFDSLNVATAGAIFMYRFRGN